MKKNEIWRSYGTDYKEMTKRLLAQTDLAGMIPPAALRIGIKPNLVCPTPASYGATTHPEVIAGIIEYLHEHKYRDITIAEGSWVGDRTYEAFEYCGYRTLAEQYGVKLLDTQKSPSFTKDCSGMELHICSCVRDFDFLINVPVLKGHCQTQITCALKNMKGLIPNKEKRRFHTMGLHKPVAHLNTGIRQDFIVIDHICGDLNFEEGGSPVVRNCVMAAADPVLCDAFVCWLLNIPAEDVPYIPLAEKLGVGSADISTLRLVTCEGEAFENLPADRRILDVSYAVDESDSCSACYASLIPALDRLKKEGILDRLDVSVGIGQGHRGKTGLLGVGNCTSGFTHCIKGCPPTEEEVYEGLLAWLRQDRH